MTKEEQFMLESNHIEGEDRINPDDIEALNYVLATNIENEIDICNIHGILGRYLKEDWVGQYRTCNVYIGGNCCPNPNKVSYLMDEYMSDFIIMDSWEAHNKFELIHPFQDLNGRVGRLIWLSKAIYEGYSFKIPFLQAYYYQTLTKQGND